jgi:hypothetical protein
MKGSILSYCLGEVAAVIKRCHEDGGMGRIKTGQNGVGEDNNWTVSGGRPCVFTLIRFIISYNG